MRQLQEQHNTRERATGAPQPGSTDNAYAGGVRQGAAGQNAGAAAAAPSEPVMTPTTRQGTGVAGTGMAHAAEQAEAAVPHTSTTHLADTLTGCVQTPGKQLAAEPGVAPQQAGCAANASMGAPTPDLDPQEEAMLLQQVVLATVAAQDPSHPARTPQGLKRLLRRAVGVLGAPEHATNVLNRPMQTLDAPMPSQALSQDTVPGSTGRRRRRGAGASQPADGVADAAPSSGEANAAARDAALPGDADAPQTIGSARTKRRRGADSQHTMETDQHGADSDGCGFSLGLEPSPLLPVGRPSLAALRAGLPMPDILLHRSSGDTGEGLPDSGQSVSSISVPEVDPALKEAAERAKRK